MREKFPSGIETLADEAKRLLPKLQEIASILNESGVTVIDEMLTIPYLATQIQASRERGTAAFPITHEGVDGIRITLSKNGVIVWFTNGFENKDNEKRREIEQRLQTLGVLLARE